MRSRSSQVLPRGLGRAIRYLGNYRREAAFAYAALLLATGAQLVVPQLIQRIIDAVTKGMAAERLLELPAQAQASAAATAGLDPQGLANLAQGAERALLWTGLLVMVFAVIRGLFAFSQAYMGELVSQSVSFDFRNELFAKIQRLSFSYHDRNQTGQLMVRATDDVEKVRLFIGQGLLMAVQSLVMLTGTLVLLWLANWRLTLVILPILPLAIFLFMSDRRLFRGRCSRACSGDCRR